MEVYYALLRDGGPRQKAREVVASFEPVLIDFSITEILGAIDLRVRWPRRRTRISYVDAVSYHLAQRRRLQFLTGDPAFKGLPGVAFIRISESRSGAK